MDCLMSAQLEKLTKLLEFLRKTCKLHGETAQELWFDLLSHDHPKEHVLAYHLIFYVLFTGLVPEYYLIKKLLPILMSKRFSLNWLLDVDSSVLDTKLDYARHTFAKMLKDLAKTLQEKHDSQIPINYKELVELLGIDDRAAMLYLNYSEERSGVSFLLVM